MMKFMREAVMVTGMTFLLVACGGEESGTAPENKDEMNQEESKDMNLEEFEGTLDHVHGIGYTDAEGITFAAHDGLKIYQNEKWKQSPSHTNDYMGFNAIEEGMYVSGHPGGSSDLPNPIGLQKGGVGKEQLEHLGFEGESDFHVLGVGYRNEAIYLLNSQPDENLGTGLYRSFDQGKTFEAMKAENLPEQLFQLAVHPTEESIVAAATKSGVFLSTDAGDSFQGISEKGQASGLTFTEKELYFGLLQEEGKFKTYNMETETVTDVPLPALKEDAVLYSAVHPSGSEMVVYTMNGNGLVKKGDEKTWKNILDSGSTSVE